MLTLRLLFDWVAKNGRQHTGMIPVSVAQPVPVYRYGGSAGMRTLIACLTSSLGRVLQGQARRPSGETPFPVSRVRRDQRRAGAPGTWPIVHCQVTASPASVHYRDRHNHRAPGPAGPGSCHGQNLKFVYQNSSLSGTAIDSAQGSN